MGKLTGFRKYLQNNRKPYMTIAFSDIEQMIGQPLCYSAYHYRPYWSPSGHKKSMGGLIIDCGYVVDQVDFSRKTVSLKSVR